MGEIIAFWDLTPKLKFGMCDSKKCISNEDYARLESFVPLKRWWSGKISDHYYSITGDERGFGDYGYEGHEGWVLNR